MKCPLFLREGFIESVLIFTFSDYTPVRRYWTGEFLYVRRWWPQVRKETYRYEKTKIELVSLVHNVIKNDITKFIKKKI